ncbi:radical SAM protein [Planctomycetaceae bacterium SCGC AG-212-F19]|nr:radical SAM protein [Planctomycetaceae bacterium SCGC AG-212-F19]
MRSPGSVLLISCYELGHQPLAVALPLGFLERAGFAPQAMDISVEAFETDKIARASLVAISVPMHTALRLGVRVADRVREINPAARICFYGLYAALNADYLLEHGGDYCIGGECETPLVSLAEALDRGATGPVEGVIQRNVPAGPYLRRLPFTLPMRDALPPLQQYARLEYKGERHVVGYVEGSRGCMHLCTHCPIPPVYGGRFFVIPQEIVLEDIRRHVKAGATHITFGDPDFLNGPGHSLKIVRAMHAEFPNLTFDFTAKVQHILERREMYPELGALGCLFQICAVESLSETVLNILEKHHTRQDVAEALGIVRDAGIALRPTWVAFTPWTSLDDYIEVLDFIEENGLIDHVDPVQYTIRLLVPPGSYLLDRPAMKAHLGPLNQESFSYRWVHPDPRMDRLQKEVSAVVEAAAKVEEDPAVTFYRVWALATGRQSRVAALPADRVRAPRLSEPWFC